MSEFASFDDYKKDVSSGGGNRSYVFQTLGLASKERRENYPSVESTVIKQIDGKSKKVTIRGRAANGYLLGTEALFANLVMRVHNASDPAGSAAKSNKQPPVLCIKTVDKTMSCPICQGYNRAKQAGQEALNKYPYKAYVEKLYVPFLCTDFIDKKQGKELLLDNEGEAKGHVFPIYWFTMSVTNYRDSHRDNLDRFIKVLHKVKDIGMPIQIISRTVADGKPQEYYFKAHDKHLEFSDFVLEHPLFDEDTGLVFFNDDEYKFEFTEEYNDLIRNLAILQSRRGTNPATDEVLSYVTASGFDKYEYAEEQVNNVVDSAWRPFTSVERE